MYREARTPITFELLNRTDDLGWDIQKDFINFLTPIPPPSDLADVMEKEFEKLIAY